VLDSQMRPTISRPSTPLARSPLPPKKRGRPSKSEVETRQAEAIARGEVLSSTKPPAKRARPFAGRFTAEGVADQLVPETDRANLGETLSATPLSNERGITHAGQEQSMVMAAPSTLLKSPPPFLTSAGIVENVPSTSGRAAMSSLSRKRVCTF
jgi:hypothetical protein